MKCVIISEEKVIDLGKRCLSNLRDFVNDEYLLGFNEVKRLRTLFFLACQKVFSEQIKLQEIINEIWNEKIQEKFNKALMFTKKSKVDDTKIEEIFYTPVCDKYTRMEFSLKETDRIFSLIEDGLNKFQELNEDLYYDIKDFKYIYEVYDYRYKSLDRD